MRRLSVTQWSMVGLVTVLLVGAFVVLSLRDAGDPSEDARDVEPIHQSPEPTSQPVPTGTPEATPQPA